MEFLATSKELNGELEELLIDCEYLRWAVAWGSVSAPCFSLLSEYRHKIKQLTIGVDSHITHPEFIEEFLDMVPRKVQFVQSKQSGAVFHPKLYYFEHSRGWDCIVGSPNFTGPAFKSNTEVAIRVSSKDRGADEVQDKICATLKRYRRSTKLKKLNATDIKTYSDIYRNTWRLRQRQGDPIQDFDSPSRNPKEPPSDDRLFTANWREYYQLMNDTIVNKQGLDEVLGTLQETRNIFKPRRGETSRSFRQIKEESRLRIAGIKDWRAFGYTWRVKPFYDAVVENNKYLSESLGHIPLDGEIKRKNFNLFVASFMSAFDGELKNPRACATRLLVYKRPDYFVAFNGRSERRLCEVFDIPLTLKLHNYWDEVIEHIMNTKWWRSKPPTRKNSREWHVWRCRVALLDVHFDTRFYLQGD